MLRIGPAIWGHMPKRDTSYGSLCLRPEAAPKLFAVFVRSLRRTPFSRVIHNLRIGRTDFFSLPFGPGAIEDLTFFDIPAVRPRYLTHGVRRRGWLDFRSASTLSSHLSRLPNWGVGWLRRWGKRRLGIVNRRDFSIRKLDVEGRITVGWIDSDLGFVW